MQPSLLNVEKETLRKHLVEEKLTIAETSRLLGATKNQVSERMYKWNLHNEREKKIRRPVGEFVLFRKNFKRYHTHEDCPKLRSITKRVSHSKMGPTKRFRHTIESAKLKGLKPCPFCAEVES